MRTNSNVNGLESAIISTTNSNFPDTPPTEEEFLDHANKVRSMLSCMFSVTDQEFEEILLRVRESVVVIMDVGVYINDKDTVHKSWLPDRRADINFFFWDRYKRYLENEANWNTRVTATLDKVSDEIVDLLGDPKSEQPFSRRGLVLGDVQSGKTANYTAICNKAADTGYRIIIVLAGMMENLRQQTQSRLDKEFSGRRSEYYLDPKAEQVIKNTPVGVGRFSPLDGKRIAAFTSVTKDFNINILKSNDLHLQSVTDPILLVVKKNKRILTNLYNWLSKSIDHTTDKIMLPMLLIDDEADNASVNTKDDSESPAAINACVRKLLKLFNQASYLGITATPFANIFINPEKENEMFGDDLFPKDFIYALKPPTNYVGATEIFGENAKYSDSLVSLYKEEMDEYIPFKHNKNLQIETLPPSLYEAMSYFLLFNVIRDVRGDYGTHRSMMVHVSFYTDVQNKITEIANEWLVKIKTDIRNYAALSKEERERIPAIAYLHQVWEKYGFEKLVERFDLSWDKICLKTILNRAIEPIVVRAVNQKTGATCLDYFNHKDDGLRVIAIGGNSLSRGLTLEGLGVSYFYRKSLMYDTLLQMGRWFGYRHNYNDIFKIWIAEEAIDWYGFITQATIELKSEISKMKNANQTPMEFGLKVRQHPNSLLVTARNKMKTATKVTRPVTVAGRLLETPRLKPSADILHKNEVAFKDFVSMLSKVGILDDNVASPYWRGVPKDYVAQLLLDFEAHPWHLQFQGRALSEYIEQQMGNETWDVALMIEGTGKAYPGGLKCGDEILPINTTEQRTVVVDDKMLRISGTKVRVGSGGCTKIGLTKQQIKLAQQRFKVQYGEDKNVPDSAYLIKERNPILMLHVINTKHDDKESLGAIPEFIFALGVGFPDNDSGIKTATYMVNLVELQNWIDFEEEVDL